MKKSLLAILMATVFLLSMLAPLVIVVNAVAPENPSWYYTESGVLHTDSYTLYPYSNGSMKVGFSQYGELIDNNQNVGLQYSGWNGARDPFCAGALMQDMLLLPKSVWINGWFLDINYYSKSWGYRDVWAGALFCDLSDYAKPWLRVDEGYGSCIYEWQENFLCPGVELDANGNVVNANVLLSGGRKTNGTAVTAPIEVLYDGPREFVAQTMTTVHDYNSVTKATLPLVDVIITIIYYKDLKEVILLKDVKILETAKFELGNLPLVVSNGTATDSMTVNYGMLVQFSDREEWDLGVKKYQDTPAYSSYGHFFTRGTASNDSVSESFTTSYNSLYTVLPTLPANTTYNGVAVNAYGPAPNESETIGHYDAAQIISNDREYVGFAGYWPCLSDWSIDAAEGPTLNDVCWYRAMKASDPHYIDSSSGNEPWLSPLTVGEWDFMLSNSHEKVMGTNTHLNITADTEFRGVAVYGVTDYNDGTDSNMAGHPANYMDEEAKYQLDMVFNPWDLQQALTKKTMRWVTKDTGDGLTTDFYLNYAYMFPVKTITGWPFVSGGDFVWAYGGWDAYNTQAERVLVNGVLQTRWTDYTVETDINGYVYINFTVPPSAGTLVKILFSTGSKDGLIAAQPMIAFNGSWEWLTVGRDSDPVDSAGGAMVSEFAMATGAPVKMSGFDMQSPTSPAVPYIFSQARSTLLPDRNGYLDANPNFNAGRAGLQDDFSCHVNASGDWVNGVPIASSNIINVGGPSANLGAQYWNDFDTAFATLTAWTPTSTTTPSDTIPGLAMKIVPLTCWDLLNSSRLPVNVYAPQFNSTTNKQTVGYGVISTYEDLNGTIGLNIWGYTAQDTYYLCWSMIHSDVLWIAFESMPRGVTSLIVKFNYALHPTDYCFVTIVEALGTISEFDYQKYLNPTGAPSVPAPFPYWPTTWVADKFPTIHPDP
jgi:hypothetical protein